MGFSFVMMGIIGVISVFVIAAILVIKLSIIEGYLSTRRSTIAGAVLPIISYVTAGIVTVLLIIDLPFTPELPALLLRFHFMLNIPTRIYSLIYIVCRIVRNK
ncbi:MAG: hypothetical protein ACI4JX_07075 [Oscillospiraceae bacterium]